MTKYLIFAIELIAIFLWLFFGTKSLGAGIIGVIVIIAISQFLHWWLKAR